MPQGEVISVNLLSREMKNEALPTTDIFMNGRKCTALVDTGCMQALVSKFMCHSWRPGEVSMLTADVKTLKSWVQSRVQLGINGTKPVNTEALIMNWRLLGFNLILRNDAIRAAGDITIMPARVMSFAGKKVTVCAVICLD